MKIRAQKLSGDGSVVNLFTIHPLGYDQLEYLDRDDIENLNNIAQNQFSLKFSVKKTAYVFYLKAEKLIPDSIIIEVEDSLLTVSQVDLPSLNASAGTSVNAIDSTNQADTEAAVKITKKTDDSHTLGLNSSIIGFAHTFALPLFVKINELKLYYRGNILLIILPRE